MKLQVAKGRKYNPNEDINMPGIDITIPVYPIRGSYQQYQCAAIYPDRTNLNRNCTLYSQPKASGVCYKNDFGDWKCKMVDVHAEVIKDHIAPPGATKPKPAPADAKPGQHVAPQTQPQTEKPDAEAKNPKPDFSEMEPWFEIVGYQYPIAPDRMMEITFQPKGDAAKRPLIFYVEFRDKDGMLVQGADLAPLRSSSDLMETATGTTGKVKVQVPFESLMKQVTSVKVVRAK